jgi:hypothetical protein
MSVTDFLFEGQAPTPTTLTGTATSQLPEWYNEYTKNMLGRAQAIADIPYSTYGGPRIAGFTPTEQTGMAATQKAAGTFEPFLEGAKMALGRAGETTGMGAAAPYLQAAGTTFPGAVSQYMSPYTQNVVNRIADVGLRQLQEKFLPAIGEEFTKAGQFGGSRMGEFGARALRDVGEAVLSEQAKALESGYKTAADIYGADVSRMADLARISGGLGAQDIQSLMGLAGKYGELGGTAQELGLRGAEAVTGVGAAERQLQQQNLALAYQDFLRQQGYPAEQAKFLSGMLEGVRLPETKIEQTQTLPRDWEYGTTGAGKVIGGIKDLKDLYDLIKKFG